jgi:hypothetical protein
MHISVAEDVNAIFSDLGHRFDRNSLSGHNWVNGAPNASVKALTKANWTSVGPELPRRFYQKNKPRFDEFDGFVVSYPPAFALLFEPFDKPVISVTCTRFDYPTFPNHYGWLIQGLRRMHQNGQLVSVANNRLDQWFNEHYLGIPTAHISSLCAYLPPRVEQPKSQESFLAWTRYAHSLQHDLINPVFTISNRYDRQAVASHAGVIHVPYNLSIMSAFEHYWQCIPMYFPTERLQAQWMADPEVGGLQEVLFADSALQFSPDLISLADWYDPTNFAGVRFFDDETELYSMTESDDSAALGARMFEHNKTRKQNVYSSWEALISRLG